MKKRVLSLALSLMFCAASVKAAPQYNYIEKTETESVSEGLIHEFRTSFTSDGIRGINILRFNLSNPNLELVPLVNKNTVSKAQVVSELVAGNGAIAGVNGDFFNYKPLFPLGLAIQNGEMIYSNSASDHPTPSILIGKDNSLNLGRVEIGMNLLVGEHTIPVGTINKPNGYGSTGVYTSRWGLKSRGGKSNSQTEIAISNGIVIDRKDGAEALNIPADGFVVNIKDGLYLPSVGESASLQISGINLDDIKFGLGAGSQILKDGKKINSHINISGRHPRTAIAFNKSTLDAVLVTVDGRSVYHGMDMDDLSDFLLSLGMTDAFNLDGGGSTTMAIRNVNTGKNEVVNHIHSQRAVANGVGLVSKSIPGRAAKLEIIPESKKMFKNTSQKLEFKLYDEKGNPLKTDVSGVSISSDGEAVINGAWFRPLQSGEVTLTITAAGITEQLKINVLDSPEVLLLPTDTISLSAGKSYTIQDVIGVDGVGNRARISAGELQKSVYNNVGTIEGNTFTRNDKEGNGAIALSFGNAKERIIISDKAKKVSIHPMANLAGLTATKSPAEARSFLQIMDEKQGKTTRLWYNFEQAKLDKSAGFNLNNGNLPKDTAELSIFAKDLGDLKMEALVNVGGKNIKLDFEENIKVGAYTEMRAKLPGENGMVLKNISVHEIEGQGGKGYVDLKYIAAVVSPDTSKMYPELRTLFVDHLRNDALPSKDIAILVSGKEAKQEDIDRAIQEHKLVSVVGSHTDWPNATKSMVNPFENLMIANFKNTQGGLRATDITQWNELLVNVKNCDKNLVIITIDGGTKDELGMLNSIEASLLKETFEEMVKAGKRVFVVTNLKKPTSSIFDEGVRYLNLNPDKTETIMLNINRLGNNIVYGIKSI